VYLSGARLGRVANPAGSRQWSSLEALTPSGHQVTIVA
jgi:hypothetical protein